MGDPPGTPPAPGTDAQEEQEIKEPKETIEKLKDTNSKDPTASDCLEEEKWQAGGLDKIEEQEPLFNKLPKTVEAASRVLSL